MFVDFLPSPAPPPRASDTDREITVDMLCAAVADGRLTLAELDERVEAALSARTLRDLAGLIADLSPYRPVTRPSRSPTTAPASVEPRTTKRKPASRTDRWAIIQSLLPAESQPGFA
jgi:hypothetical protein